MLAALALAVVFHAPHDPINCWAVSPDFGQDHTIFVGQDAFGMLLRSRDGGANWQTVQAGLDTGYVHALAISPDYAADGTLYTAEVGGLFRTSNAGDLWERVSDLPAGTSVRTIAFSPDFGNDRTIALGTGGGLVLTRDGGKTWTTPAVPGKGAVNAILFEAAFAGSGHMLILRDGATAALSRNGGRDFSALPVPPGGRLTGALLGSGFGIRGAMTLARGKRGVWASTDFGETWAPDGQGLPTDDEVLHLSSVRNALGRPVQFASLARSGVYWRVDGGAWQGGRAGMRERSDQSPVHHLAAQPVASFATEPVVFAATFEGLHVSLDGAATWSYVPVLPPRFARSVLFSPGFSGNGALLVSSYGEGVLIGRDGGSRWDRLDTGPWAFPDGLAMAPGWPEDPTLMVGTPTALLLSRDGGSSFANCNPGSPGFLHVGAFAPDYASTGTIYAHTLVFGKDELNEFLRSDDRGRSWTRTGPSTIHDLAFAPDFASTGRMYVATPSGVDVSHDRGRSWSALPGLPRAMMYAIAATAGTQADQLLAVSPMAGVFRSMDAGRTWESADDGLDGARSTAVAFSPDHAEDGLAFLLTRSQGVFARGPGESRWRLLGLAGQYASGMSISPGFEHDKTLAVAGYAGVFISRDAGASWSLLDPTAKVSRPAPLPPAAEEDTTTQPRQAQSSDADWSASGLLIGLGAALLVAAVVLVSRVGRRRGAGS